MFYHIPYLRSRSYYYFQPYSSAATNRGRLLYAFLYTSCMSELLPPRPLVWLLLEGSSYSSELASTVLFEGGYYSGCGYYSSKYGMHVIETCTPHYIHIWQTHAFTGTIYNVQCTNSLHYDVGISSILTVASVRLQLSSQTVPHSPR